MKQIRKTFRLPVVYRSLDLEDLTKPQGTVVCPIRNEPVTIGTCGHCDDFLRVEFDADSRPHICCMTRDLHERRASAAKEPCTIQQMLHVPLLSVSRDTPLAALVPYLELQRPWDFTPVLDADTKPVGVVGNEALRRLVAEGVDLSRPMESVMSEQFACVYPWQRTREAADVRPNDGFRGVIVVGLDGRFIGLVAERDLVDAA